MSRHVAGSGRWSLPVRAQLDWDAWLVPDADPSGLGCICTEAQIPPRLGCRRFQAQDPPGSGPDRDAGSSQFGMLVPPRSGLEGHADPSRLEVQAVPSAGSSRLRTGSGVRIPRGAGPDRGSRCSRGRGAGCDGRAATAAFISGAGGASERWAEPAARALPRSPRPARGGGSAGARCCSPQRRAALPSGQEPPALPFSRLLTLSLTSLPSKPSRALHPVGA